MTNSSYQGRRRGRRKRGRTPKGRAALSGRPKGPGGMSLLDYFAGQALVGLLAGDVGWPGTDRYFSEHLTETAGDAYAIAQAMLAEKRDILNDPID